MRISLRNSRYFTPPDLGARWLAQDGEHTGSHTHDRKGVDLGSSRPRPKVA